MDPKNPNPYAEPLAGQYLVVTSVQNVDVTIEASMGVVLLELAREEDAAAANGDQVTMHKVSPVSFIKQGLHLEERQ